MKAINLLQQYHIRHLPILDDQDCLVGIVTHESLRQISRPMDLLRLRLVREVMTPEVICAEPNCSMLAIAQQMAERRVSSVVIVEPSETMQIPLGILTERDLLQFQALGLNIESYRLEPERQVQLAIAPQEIVWGDATLMRAVLRNLLQNAWKFTSHHPTAHIEFGVIYQDGEKIYFVRDDGAGFDMSYAKQLFGVFQRLHGTHEFPGTGIGLATVQRAIHRHGGKVWAEATIEQGATFYFTLPKKLMNVRTGK